MAQASARSLAQAEGIGIHRQHRIVGAGRIGHDSAQALLGQYHQPRQLDGSREHACHHIAASALPQGPHQGLVARQLAGHGTGFQHPAVQV